MVCFGSNWNGMFITVPILITEYWSEIKRKFSHRDNSAENKKEQIVKGEKSMDIELENLVSKYLRDFESKKNLRIAVPNSIPIIWFGDMGAYKKSSVKIVTIALNPSHNEFPESRKEHRFDTNANMPDALYKTLNNYFYDKPYKMWFAQFEKCLKRINSSYGGKMAKVPYEHTAIHIDAYSAIATNPTWGNLTQREKDSVNQQNLCEQLLEYLQPDIILMSTAHDTFMETLHIKRPYHKLSESYDGQNRLLLEIYKQNNQILVFGKHALGAPFGCISNEILDKAFAIVNQEITRK